MNEIFLMNESLGGVMVTKLFGPLFYELWFRNTARVTVSVDEPSDVRD